jgi:hypothetical protein
MPSYAGYPVISMYERIKCVSSYGQPMYVWVDPVDRMFNTWTYNEDEVSDVASPVELFGITTYPLRTTLELAKKDYESVVSPKEELVILDIPSD